MFYSILYILGGACKSCKHVQEHNLVVMLSNFIHLVKDSEYEYKRSQGTHNINMLLLKKLTEGKRTCTQVRKKQKTGS